MPKFCEHCGAPLEEGDRFCTGCGHPVAQLSQPHQPQNTTKSKPKAHAPKPAPEKKRIGLKVFLIVALVAVLGYGVSEYLSDKRDQRGYKEIMKDHDELKKKLGKKKQPQNSPSPSSQNVEGTMVYTGKGFSEQVATADGDRGVTLGGMKTANLKMFVENGTFPEGTVIEAEPASKEVMGMIQHCGKFESAVAPMNIKCDQYDGSFFGTDVVLTMSMPRTTVEEDMEQGKYVFVCYDENTKQMRYLWPTDYDKEKNTMSVRMPHFSLWWSAKMTDEEELDQFLDEYSMSLAVQQGKQKQAASELAPYLEAKAKALGLTKEAAKDLVQSTINIIIAKASSSYDANDDGKEYDFQEDPLTTNSTKLMTGLIRAYWDNDEDTKQSAVNDFITSSMMMAWGDLEYSTKAKQIFKSEYVKEFVPGAIEQPLSNMGGIVSMAGRFSEGDTEGAMQELGNILQGVHPAAEIGTKSVVFIARTVNTAYTYWMDNEVEELYQVYKHGAKGWFGNEVIPGDRETFLEFLNYSSGFTKAKGVARFYNMDKVAETCEKYGWSRSSYDKLSPEQKAVFEKRAEDGLMQYFELRRQQEAEAAKIKAREKEVVKELMDCRNFGALCNYQYSRYFGEESYKDYSVTKRMRRLIELRSILSQYVDEDELNSSKNKGAYNWGTLLNKWVSIASQYPREKALEMFREYLKGLGLLKQEKAQKVPSVPKEVPSVIQGFPIDANFFYIDGLQVLKSSHNPGPTVIYESKWDPDSKQKTKVHIVVKDNDFRIEVPAFHADRFGDTYDIPSFTIQGSFSSKIIDVGTTHVAKEAQIYVKSLAISPSTIVMKRTGSGDGGSCTSACTITSSDCTEEMLPITEAYFKWVYDEQNKSIIIMKCCFPVHALRSKLCPGETNYDDEGFVSLTIRDINYKR